MAAATWRRGSEPLPRGLLWIGTPVAGVLLVAFFVYLGFPYDRLADWVSWRVGEATGMRVQIGELEPRLGWLPGFEARDVRVVDADGARTDLERAWVRPAWSLSWLRLQPALYAELDAPQGSAAGVVWPAVPWSGSAPGFEGELRGIDVQQLPLEGLVAGLAAQGRLDADVALRLADGEPEGTARFVATRGSLTHPSLPLPVPFEALQGELVLGGEQRLALQSLSLQGPLVSGEARGTLGAGDLTRAPLDVELRVEARDPNVRSLLRSSGVRLDRDGSALIRLTGTLSDPLIR